MIRHEIGTAAGVVWSFLNDNGPSTAAKIKSELKMKQPLLWMAIGWLSCEDKLEEVKKGRARLLKL